MITLYAFGPAFGVADPSPFVLKTQTFMRMVNIPYESIGSAQNLQKSPKGKLPFIKDNKEIISDSFFILNHLTAKHAIDLDDHLTPEQLAQTHFISKSIEESLYWCAVYFRWIYEENWQFIKKEFFGKMPFPLNKIVPIIAQKGVKKSLHGHGLGRHSEQEILLIAEKHLEALSVFLGEKKYCFGDKPSSLDATVYAFLAEIILVSLDSPLSERAKKYKNLVNYSQRMHDQYFSTS